MFLNKTFFFGLIALFMLPMQLSAASKDDARAFAEKAAAYINQHGVENSLDIMHDKNGEFHDGELYVFALKFDGVTVIHGVNPKLEGKNLINAKDPKGTYFVKEMTKAAKEQGSGWVHYMWKHPKTKKLTNKVSYVKRIGSKELYVGVGVYLQ